MKSKRILSTLLALCMILFMLPLTVLAAETASGTCGENLTWTLDSTGKLTISGTGKMDDYSYAASAPWYAYRSDITSVDLGDGITSIGNGAFSDCESITSITIPSSVTRIGDDAFYNCNSLTNIIIPNGVTSIGDYTFGGCGNLISITIPASVSSIGIYAFDYCTGLTSISVDAQSLYYKSIDGVLFNKNGSTLMQYPAGKGESVYHISSGVTSIGDGAFVGCNSLTSITIPNSVTSIGGWAFADCERLTSITIPSSVTSIGDLVFSYCYSLTNISVDAGNPNYKSIDGVLFDKNGSTLIQYPAGKDEAVYHIPSGVTSIGDWAFYFCESLTSITIPSSVTSIGSGVFCGCYVLTRLTFSGNAPSIDYDAFLDVTATAYYPAGNTTWKADVMRDYGGTITWVSYEAEPQIPVPSKPYKIANVVSGVHVYWTAIEGVEKYGLWRSENGKDGTYKWIANPTVPHFTDTNVESGKTYYYKVTAMVDGKHSDKSEAIGVTYVATPDITSRTNTAAGVKMSWDKITGATGYAIYRKSYSGTDAWVRVGTISGNSTFTWTDTSVKNNNGEVYKYTIRALAGSDMKTLSGCRNAGRTMVRLSSQVLTSATKASSTSVLCKWTASSKVTGYEIRFLVNGEVYKTFTVGNYKTGTKTFTGLKAGQTYTVQVRTYKKVDGVGSFYSDWSTAKTVKI